MNSTSKTIAVVDLNARAVTSVLPALQDTPEAVGINPVTGRALVAMQRTNYGVLVDVTTNPPSYAGIVSISTGPNPRVAVDPNLNWAIATPGGLGSVGIVDLNQQAANAITAISRTANGTADVVTVTVQSTSSAPPLSVVVGDAVYIQNVQFRAAHLPRSPRLLPLLMDFIPCLPSGPGPTSSAIRRPARPNRMWGPSQRRRPQRAR